MPHQWASPRTTPRASHAPAWSALLIGVLLPARAAAVIIDFETLSSTVPGTGGRTVVTNQYVSLGVSFNACVLLDYSKNPAIPGFAHSGARALEQCYGAEFCSTPITVSFNQPQSRVKVWVGYSSPNAGSKTAVMTAYDDVNAPVGSVTGTVGSANGYGLIRTPLELVRASAVIRRVEIGLQGENTNGLALDDLEFGTSTGSDLWVQPGSTTAATRRLMLRVGNLGPKDASMPVVMVQFDGNAASPAFPGPLAAGADRDFDVDLPATLAPGNHAYLACMTRCRRTTRPAGSFRSRRA